MKKQILLFLALITFTTGFAQGFIVNNYEIDIYINADGYFDVVEKYEITFQISKHGIYRDILTRYDMVNFEGENVERKIKVTKVDVPDHQYEATNFYLKRISDNMRIKIGDPDKTVRGLQFYEIRYRVSNAFLHEPDSDRFYWNLKPTDWLALFQDLQFRIHLPDNAALDMQDFKMYSGAVGSTFESDDFTITQENGIITGTAIQGFSSNYGDAVTVLVDLPKGAVKEYKEVWPFWNNYGWTLICGALVFGFYFFWRKHGKDDPAPTTMSYHPPEDLDPAMAGFLIDDKEDTADLISLIPYWGTKGYLKLQEIEKKGWLSKSDTKLTKLKNIPGASPNYQRTMFNGLFYSGDEVLISSLRNSFYTTMNSAKNQLRKAAQQYYVSKSNSIMKMTYGVLIICLLFLAPLSLFFWGLIGVVSVIVTTIVLILLTRHMVKKNRPGTRIFAELKGFKQFIKTAEENKLKMLLKESPTYFESTMGYALSFGAFSIWAKKFDALNVKPPEWYSSSAGNHFTMNNFSSSFNSAMSSASTTMVSSPSSSGSGGGGSSGGGFGGGGGGSW